MALQPGFRLGSCEIIELLGAGGMGEVYRALDQRLGREVAVKILPASFAADANRVARFEQEARAAGALNHPNLLTVHELGRHDREIYIVSELLDGESLRERLSSGPLSLSRATDYAVQIANGLAAAHDKGIVHRDLKPENIFITKDGRVKILDFGLAKFSIVPDAATDAPTANVRTDPGSVLGSAGYMSPEQVRGQGVDHRSDIFSFGAVLYEMLSGRRAFRGESAADTMSAVLREDPPELSLSGRLIPPALERIVLHCLEKNPVQRFQSVRDLGFDLQSLSAISSTQTPVRARSFRPLAILVASLVLLALGIAAGFLGSRFWSGTTIPSFTPLTFQRGGVVQARFVVPDSRTVVYGATWSGQPERTYAVTVGSPLSRELPVDGNVAGVSYSGELAILKDGKLSRMPLSGGAPREVANHIWFADWTADGRDLVVLRYGGSQLQIEFPIDHPVYRSPFIAGPIRVSHSGNWVAFRNCHGSAGPCGVAIVNAKGQKRLLLDGLAGNTLGVGWRPDDREVWFTQWGGKVERSLLAVDMNGHLRTILRLPEQVFLQDIAGNGDVLLELVDFRRESLLSRAGEPDRDFSWLDATLVLDISADGKKVLFTETGAAEGENPGTYLRQTDGSPAIRLGDGYAERLSPSGDSALIFERGTPPKQTIVPTGAGSISILPVPASITDYSGIDWFPDGRSVVYSGNERSGESRLFVQRIDSSVATAITPPGVRYGLGCKCLSPDGRWVGAFDSQSHFALYPVSGGTPRSMTAFDDKTIPIQWTTDGKHLLVYQWGHPPQTMDLYDIATGKRTNVTTFSPPDAAGYRWMEDVRASADLRTFVYSYRRDLSRLVLAHGLK